MQNKAVLITGAAKRIGKAIAIAMAQNGWNIALHYNTSQNEAEDTAKYIKSFGVKVCIIQADLTNTQQLEKIFAQANQKLGVINCLVNNASVFKNDTIQNFSFQSWNENMAVNLYAPAALIQEFIKQIPAGQGANIINMLDYAVWRYPEKFLSYTASKSALWALTQQLGLALAPLKIRINGIGPGRVLHNIYDNNESFNKAVEAAPLGTDSSPDEIAAAINFILSSPSMTGQMIALDGGKHLTGPEVY